MMKRFLPLAVLALIATAPLAQAAEPAAAAPVAFEYKYQTPKLNRAQIDALLAKPEQVLVIDVRRPDEVTAIGGFPVYLSIQSSEVERSFALIPKDRTIITASNHAGRAGKVGDFLTAHGFKVAGAVGVQNYEKEGGKLTRITPPPPKAPDAAR